MLFVLFTYLVQLASSICARGPNLDHCGAIEHN